MGGLPSPKKRDNLDHGTKIAFEQIDVATTPWDWWETLRTGGDPFREVSKRLKMQAVFRYGNPFFQLFVPCGYISPVATHFGVVFVCQNTRRLSFFWLLSTMVGTQSETIVPDGRSTQHHRRYVTDIFNKLEVEEVFFCFCMIFGGSRIYIASKS